MKILIVIDYFQPQLGYSESFFSREFVRLGHQVQVLTSNYYFPFPNYDKTMSKVLGKRQLPEGNKKWQGITVIRKKLYLELFTRAFFGGHEKVLVQFRPDVVLVNKSAGYSAVKMAILKSKYNYKLYTYDSHLPSELLRGNIFIKRIIYRTFRWFFSGLLNARVDKFIAVQDKTREVMKKYFGIKKAIILIPLGTDTDAFHFDSKQRQLLRKTNQIDKDDFVVIYTGKIIEAKGVDILFSAFNACYQKHKNIKLVIVGSGTEDYIKKCLELLDEKYHSQVLWIPFQPVEELYKYYSLSDVAVWPLQESTSMNDAASCSLPFIANDTLGDKLRISNDNALLYKRGDVEDLTLKIEYLYSNPKKRSKMGKNGRALAEDKLSWKSIAPKYLD